MRVLKNDRDRDDGPTKPTREGESFFTQISTKDTRKKKKKHSYIQLTGVTEDDP